MRKYILETSCLPKWYGFAWHDRSRRQHVCYPLGINVIAAWLYYLYLKAICPTYIFDRQDAMEQLAECRKECQSLRAMIRQHSFERKRDET